MGQKRWCEHCVRRLTQREPVRQALQTSALTLGYSSFLTVFSVLFSFPSCAIFSVLSFHFWLGICGPGGIREWSGASNCSGRMHLPSWIPWPLLPILCSWIHQVPWKQSKLVVLSRYFATISCRSLLFNMRSKPVLNLQVWIRTLSWDLRTLRLQWYLLKIELNVILEVEWASIFDIRHPRKIHNLWPWHWALPWLQVRLSHVTKYLFSKSLWPNIRFTKSGPTRDHTMGRNCEQCLPGFTR